MKEEDSSSCSLHAGHAVGAVHEDPSYGSAVLGFSPLSKDAISTVNFLACDVKMELDQKQNLFSQRSPNSNFSKYTQSLSSRGTLEDDCQQQ